MKENKNAILEALKQLIEKNGLDVLACLEPIEILKPLIHKDWIGTGGKLGYGPLASRYNLTQSQIKTICSKFEKPVKN